MILLMLYWRDYARLPELTSTPCSTRHFLSMLAAKSSSRRVAMRRNSEVLCQWAIRPPRVGEIQYLAAVNELH